MSGSSTVFSRGENPLRADKLNQAYSERVLRSGDTMTGFLTLVGDPANAFHAATKQYVDTHGPAGVANVLTFGAVCDGVTDDTAAVNAAIAYCASTGGGVVQFPAGTCLMLGAMVLPYTATGGNNPVQVPIRLTGAGGSPDGYLGNSVNGPSVPIGGTVLDMRYAGSGSAVAKIDTRGAGILEIDHLTIADKTPHASYSNTVLVQTTNTTLLIHDCRFVGDVGASGTACLQDAIRLGAIVGGGGLANNSPTCGFQGYGTKIENNHFDYIREGVQFGSAANGTWLANNTFTAHCGSAKPLGAAYYFYGQGYGAVGNTIFGGIVEMRNYPYAATFDSPGSVILKSNTLDSIGLYDENMGSPTLGGVYFDANSFFNVYIVGFADQPLQAGPLVQGPGLQQNMVIDSLSGITRFPYGFTIGQDASNTTLNIDGNNGTNGGSAVAFHNAGTLTGMVGTYSRIYGGTYTNALALYAAGHGVSIASDNLSIRTGAPPTSVLDVGDSTGGSIFRFNGGNTAASDGTQIRFSNGGALIADIGNYSGVIGGGSYSNIFTIYGGTHGILIPSDRIGIKTGAALDPVGAEIGIGDGTGQRRILLSGGNTNTADGALVLFYNNSVRTGGVGNANCYFNTAYATYARASVLAGYDGVVFCTHDVEAGRIVGSAGGQRWLIGTPTDDTSTLLQVGGTMKVNGNIGFNNTAPVAKPTVSGSRGGNAALASLITALAAYGLVTDSTTV